MSAEARMDSKQLFEEYRRTGDKKLRNRIVEDHLYMVDILVKKFMNKGVDYEDLYQVGSMALVLAAERFHPDKGFAFTSFATPTIIGEIKRYFRDKGWALKVPRRLKEISSALPGASEQLENRLGRKAKPAELAEYLNCSPEEILEAMEGSRAYGTYSLQQTFDERGAEGEASPFERFAVKEERGYQTLENADWLRTVFRGLGEKEKKIFQMRFLDNKSQQEIAKSLGVSQMTVSRMEKKLKDKLKEEYYR